MSNSTAAGLLPSKLLKTASFLCWKSPVWSSLHCLGRPWNVECPVPGQRVARTAHSVPDVEVGQREVLKPGPRESRLKMICLVFQPPWVEPVNDHGRLRTKHTTHKPQGRTMLFPGNPTTHPSGVSQEKGTPVRLHARVRAHSAAPGLE